MGREEGNDSRIGPESALSINLRSIYWVSERVSKEYPGRLDPRPWYIQGELGEIVED